jgi:two-component system, cell cycle sensor histidine kinase and response regulator CckA
LALKLFDPASTPSPKLTGPINLLITDVVMPGMNGKDLRDKLSRFKPGFRHIFMSG